MATEPELERVVREAVWPWPRRWRAFLALPLAVRVLVVAAWLVAGAAFFWMADQRPYDLWSMYPSTLAPADLKCDRWISGHAPGGTLTQGEVVRVIAEKRSEYVDWIRVARKAGGACWMDRYYWDEAEAQRQGPQASVGAEADP